MSKKSRNDKYRKSLKGRYATLKRNAVRNGFAFDISLYDYALLTANGCVYCEDELPVSGHGVDRKSSRKGYVQGNVQPCCAICNIAKGSMEHEVFVEHVLKIAKALSK